MIRPDYVYVASSWRCEAQADVVQALRAAEIECYDFKNPNDQNTGFHWSEVMPSFDSKKQLCDQGDYLLALTEPRSIEGFGSDMDAMRKADTCVLVLPCGRSAHLELGWFVGKGKQTIVLLDGPVVTPELMYLMVDHIATSVEEVVAMLTAYDKPRSLNDAVHAAAGVLSKDKKNFPKGYSAGDVLTQIRAMYGSNAYPLVSVLDVHDSLRELYGEPSGRR